jgi:ABC-type antimicrobial peptide transport system permease subunit
LTGITSAIGQRIERLNPAITIQFVELKSQIRERLIRERMIAWVAGAFGIVAMTLVGVGLYGIIAYLSVSRRNEIGIRLALGSTRAQIAGLVVRENLWLMSTGLAIGLPLAVAVMRGARALLFGLTPTDVPTVMGAASLLAAVGAFAAALPAWRAARICPDVALRCD